MNSRFGNRHRAIKRCRPAETPTATPAAIPAEASIRLLRAQVLPGGTVRRFFSVDLSNLKPSEGDVLTKLAAPRSGRRILKEFTLSEISAVDGPANEHARAAILKSTHRQPDPAPVVFNSLDEAIIHLQKLHGRVGGLRRAREIFPEAVEKFRGGDDSSPVMATSSDPIRSFDALVEKLRADDPHLSRTAALVKARAAHPDAFAAAYGEAV